MILWHFFQGHNTFTNNSGANNGGAIALYGKSYIVVQANSTLEITNNTANNLGGGIYIAEEQWSTTDESINFCHINLEGDSAKIILNGNHAEITGAELYGGHIDSCTSTDGQSIVDLTTAMDLIKNTSHCGQTDVSSDARKLTFCDNHCINTNRFETEICPRFSWNTTERTSCCYRTA